MKKFLKISFLTLFLLTSSGQTPELLFATNEPEAPRAFVDTTYPSITGRAIEVRAGGNLQAAIDAAQFGDEIVLEAGAEFTGSFVLKKKIGSGWIIIRSANLSSLPKQGERVSPSSHASSMAKIKSSGSNLPALITEKGASGYRIVGVEFAKASPSAMVTNLILLGQGNETAVSDLPKNIILDRIYAHGDSSSNLRRCVAINGVSMAVVDSYLSECHEKGADSQAVAGWNGPGPFKIVNNHLEAASENVLFGGSDPSISGLVPSDIEIRQNYFYKPLAWKGKGWVVKNLFETKNAKRVLVDGNIFENSWTEGQTGTAILIKSANQDGKCTWCVSSDILFSNNIVKNVNEGLRINAAEGSPLPLKVSRIKFENMIFENVQNKLFQIFNGSSDIIFENVTAYSPESILFGDGGTGLSNTGLAIRNSVLERGLYGVGAGSEEGKAYLDKWFPGSSFENNVLINSGQVTNESLSKLYPTGTQIVARNSVPGGVGANLSKINAAIKSSVISTPTPTAPTPTTPAPVSSPSPSSPAPSTPVVNSETVTVISRSSSGGGGGRSTGSGGGSSNPAPTVSTLSPAPVVLGVATTDVSDIQAKIAFLMAQLATLQGNSAPVAVAGFYATANPTSARPFSSNLGVGSSGSEVISLQQMLVSQGYLKMPAGTAYGYFGPMTRAAVARWQASRGLTATGFFGPLSRAKVINL